MQVLASINSYYHCTKNITGHWYKKFNQDHSISEKPYKPSRKLFEPRSRKTNQQISIISQSFARRKRTAHIHLFIVNQNLVIIGVHCFFSLPNGCGLSGFGKTLFLAFF
jgi:hypothetical protein